MQSGHGYNIMNHKRREGMATGIPRDFVPLLSSSVQKNKCWLLTSDNTPQTASNRHGTKEVGLFLSSSSLQT